MQNLGCKTNIEVIQEFVNLNGRRVIDAGCGGMALARQLADIGADVLAVDPDPVQAELNRNSESISGVQFIETGADNFPVSENSMDGVFFGYSLHHVPAEIYPDVFAEVRRVLKSNGFLYVIEPTDCPLNDVMKLFHDEDIVRAAAQSALHEIAIPMFKTNQSVVYHSFRDFDSFDDFATQFTSKTFNTDYSERDVRCDRVRNAFEKMGQPDYRFAAPKQVMFLQGLNSA